MRKGGKFELTPAEGAKKYISLSFAPIEMPGAYEIRRFSDREEAEMVMEEYMSKKKEFKFYNGEIEHSSLNVEGFYQVSEHWDTYLK